MAHQQCTNWIDILYRSIWSPYWSIYRPLYSQTYFLGSCPTGCSSTTVDHVDLRCLLEESWQWGKIRHFGWHMYRWGIRMWPRYMANLGNTLKYPRVTINIWRPIPTSKSQRSPTLICQGFLFVLRMVIWYMWPTTWIFSGGLKGWNFTAFKRLAAFVISC